MVEKRNEVHGFIGDSGLNWCDLMAIFAMFIRMKAAKKPASAKKILLPPVFMSTGALMYIFPEFRLSFMEIIQSVIIGMLFSILLIKTSKFEIKDDEIYLKQSRAFMIILIGLFIVRIVAKWILSATIDLGELSGMFFLLAFSMILPWRIAMYRDFKKLYLKINPSTGSTDNHKEWHRCIVDAILCSSFPKSKVQCQLDYKDYQLFLSKCDKFEKRALLK